MSKKRTTTTRQAANRRNAQQSTGPRTEVGKRASSQNALKFGFFSKKALLPGESWEDYLEFHQELLEQLGPRNPMESHMVEEYIPVAFRLRRLPELEAFAFDRYGISVQGNQCGPGFAMVANVQTDNIIGQLARYEATLRKTAFKFFDQLRSLRTEGWGDPEPEVIDVVPEVSTPAPLGPTQEEAPAPIDCGNGVGADPSASVEQPAPAPAMPALVGPANGSPEQ